MDLSQVRIGLFSVCLILVWFASSANGALDPELVSLLKQVKTDIMKMDVTKLQPACRKGLSKCRAKSLVILQMMKVIQEDPAPFLESTCLVERLRKGMFDMDQECDMKEQYGEDMQCFRDPVLTKAMGSKRASLASFMNCMAENSLNYDSKNPKHKF